MSPAGSPDRSAALAIRPVACYHVHRNDDRLRRLWCALAYWWSFQMGTIEGWFDRHPRTRKIARSARKVSGFGRLSRGLTSTTRRAAASCSGLIEVGKCRLVSILITMCGTSCSRDGLTCPLSLPREEFCICLTREAEFEIPPIPSGKADLKAFIDQTIAKCGIQTDSFFGFYDPNLPPDEQRVAGFDIGR